MGVDNPYEALAEVADDSRWAFGTNLGLGVSPSQSSDPLSGMDATVPSAMDGAELAEYCLMLGDDALIMSHRLQEWCTKAPELEDEVAIANIGLDLLGQARFLLARAGKAEGQGRDEDSLAFFRDGPEFRNVWLAEAGGGHFGHLVARLVVFSIWRLALLRRLESSADAVLAAIAAKGAKEVAYHRDYAVGWMVRLGDGTELSHERMREGLADTWPLVGELFTPHPVELSVGVDPTELREEFDAVLDQVLSAATLARPRPAGQAEARQPELSGRNGAHSAQLGPLLVELQGVARAHPDATW